MLKKSKPYNMKQKNEKMRRSNILNGQIGVIIKHVLE